MNINEFYDFTEDTNVSIRYSSYFDEQADDFPCPADMSYAFRNQPRGCVKNLNTSNVTNMSGMFYNCNSLVNVPQLNTSNVTNMGNMFYYCENLRAIPFLDTSNVTNMEYMFYSCGNLLSIPLLDTSKVTNMYNTFGSCRKLTTIPQLNTSNVTNMNNMFYDFDGSQCKLKSLPPLDCSKVTDMGYYFSYSFYPRTALTDVGGWINLKCKWDDEQGLYVCPNLTYESCINILNGLYDFVGNGETPNGNQGRLKVHANFIDLVGDEISIGTNKGWTITA